MDFLEIIVHECTHNFLFIDDLTFSHYLDIEKMAKRESFALSAVLQKIRPLDKVIHALIVAFEVYMFRKNSRKTYCTNEIIIHPDSHLLLNNCKISIDSIKGCENSRDILSDRIWELIDIVEKRIDLEFCRNEKMVSM